MSVYKKLMEVRLAFHKMELKKSGINKFAGYTYFELSDFIPIAQSLFAEHGLCGVVSYAQDIATLTITDSDAPEHSITITSPMADANLKGCHPIQNLGAVETYTRRYLWVTALELVEHDILDASEPIKEVKQESKPRLPTLTFAEAEKQYNAWMDEKLKYVHKDGTENQDAITLAWGTMPSNVRSAIKKYGKGEFEEQQQEVSPEAKAHLNSI